MRKRSVIIGSTVAALVASGLVGVSAASAATSTPTSAPAVAAPATRAAVTRLQVRHTSTGEQLTWSTPAGASSVVIRRSPGMTGPASVTQGQLVADLAPGADTVTDDSVDPETVYTYAAFAEYSGHAAAPATAGDITGRTVAPSAAGTGTLHGVVTDASGHPLAGALVIAESPNLSVNDPETGPLGFTVPQVLRAVTGSDGSYTIGKVRTASYQICVEASDRTVTGGTSDRTGYQDTCADQVAGGIDGASTAIPAIALPANPGATIDGTVVSSTGAPLDNVQIEVEASDEGSFYAARSNVHGRFVLHVATATYRLCFQTAYATGGTSPTGYAGRCTSAPKLAVEPGSLITSKFALANGGSVTGTLTTPDGPAVGAGVFVNSRQSFGFAETGPGGRFVVEGLSTGTVQVCGFDEPLTGTGYVQECLTESVTAGQTTSGVGIALPRGAEITGRVTNTHGVSLGRAPVILFGPKGYETFAATQADGRYAFNSLPAGGWTVCFQPATYAPQCYKDQSVDAPPTRVKVAAGQVASNIDGSIKGGTPGTVTVHVVDAGGHPIVDADVALLLHCTKILCPDSTGVTTFTASAPPSTGPENASEALDVFTGSTGLATFPDIAPGDYAACVDATIATGGSSPTGYSDNCSGDTYSIVVAAGATATSTITLPEAGAVSGTITAADGTPLPGVAVTLASSSGSEIGGAPIVTGADGSYLITGVPAGPDQACFDASTALGPSPTGYASQCYNDKLRAPTTFTVVSGHTTTGIGATLAVGGVITGTVTANGQPLAGVFVQVQPNAIGGASAVTGPDGTYIIDGLQAVKSYVCFDPSELQDQPQGGYLQQCYDGVDPITGNPTAVAVQAGKVSSGIDAAIGVGAELTGTVTDTSGDPLPIVFVLVDGRGATEDGAGTVTDPDGTFDLDGLDPGTYSVCVDGSNDGASSQCYNDVAWAGQKARIPAAAAKLALLAGSLTALNFTLDTSGS